jgi:tRNA(His) 5'-end guanylyltransferase
MDNSELAKRMKCYELVPKNVLMKKTPVAIRIDGKAFHTFTKGFQKPFDDILIKTMQETMKYLCENIQGCVLGYTQSDEITLILIDYKKLTSDAWFDYEVQKICSIAASMATMAFNRLFRENFNKYDLDNQLDYAKTLFKKLDSAMFDARCFNIPKEEVTNLIYWRQLDASRNSIQMMGQSNFSHKELQNKSCNQIQDMLMLEKGINWNDLETYKKRGSCCIKNIDLDEYGNNWGNGWIIDKEIPIFKGEDRKYIDDLIFVGE